MGIFGTVTSGDRLLEGPRFPNPAACGRRASASRRRLASAAPQSIAGSAHGSRRAPPALPRLLPRSCEWDVRRPRFAGWEGQGAPVQGGGSSHGGPQERAPSHPTSCGFCWLTLCQPKGEGPRPEGAQRERRPLCVTKFGKNMDPSQSFHVCSQLPAEKAKGSLPGEPVWLLKETLCTEQSQRRQGFRENSCLPSKQAGSHTDTVYYTQRRRDANVLFDVLFLGTGKDKDGTLIGPSSPDGLKMQQ
ncbi:uncharacterized protein LOC116659244 [Camelus ferus]|uniref:Uncharacterized protein LOC116659244 n=1 Tax=Camelus ferus TaxID=419612 RepID=A0A8B8RY06_CAMFR|nr:uncharacterized protein LOC116659244 [Camelus ferus]